MLVSDALQAEEFTIDGDKRAFELLWVKITGLNRVIYVAALYHPPKPIYETSDLMCRLELTADRISTADPGALVIIGGDFNQLNVDDVAESTGLTP